MVRCEFTSVIAQISPASIDGAWVITSTTPHTAHNLPRARSLGAWGVSPSSEAAWR